MSNEKKANEIIDSNYYVTIAEKNAAYNASLQMAQWKDEKMKKLKSIADNMYDCARNLSTDARSLRKAMEDYHNFIIHEYYD